MVQPWRPQVPEVLRHGIPGGTAAGDRRCADSRLRSELEARSRDVARGGWGPMIRLIRVESLKVGR